MFKVMPLLSFTAICLQSLALTAQIPQLVWENNYGGTGYDYGFKSLKTPDAGYLLAGYSESNDIEIEVNHGNSDFWLVKVDSLGNFQWEQNYGGNSSDVCFDMQVSLDDGFILCGYTYSVDFDVSINFGNADYWIVKVNALGDIEWEKSYGGSNYDAAKKILVLPDGNYIIAGTSTSSDNQVTEHLGSDSYTDIWIIKVNSVGDLIWEQTIGSNTTDGCTDLILTSDGNYLLIGNTSSNTGDVTGNHGAADIWIAKINVEGELLWQQSYGGTETDLAYSAHQLNSGKYIICGYTYSDNGDITDFFAGETDAVLLKIDSVGNLLWANNYGGTNADFLNEIIELPNKNYLIVGDSYSNDYDLTENKGSKDIWLTEIDTGGALIWQQTYGGSNWDDARDLLLNSDSSILIFGYSESSDFDIANNYGGHDYWLAKLKVCEKTFYLDADGDGFGTIGLDSVACVMPIGYVLNNTDCNDSNASVFPTAFDICNTFDDNCNGSIDEDALFINWFADNDADLFGNPEMDSVSCFELVGYVENNTDCNDSIATINPLSNEICNAIDDNCNTLIDEDLVIYTFFADTDGDTYGDPFYEIDTCVEMVIGFVNNNMDCNDTNALIFPGAVELCNYIDDDCDGLSDDNLIYIVSYQDADGDNFGNLLIDSAACTIPEGFVADSTDCNDTNAAIYPGAIETLNGLDDDCDQLSDEGLTIVNTAYGFTVYPNPTTGLIIIENAIGISASIQIVNTLGQIIYMSAFINATTQIDITAFAAGVYVINVMTDSAIFINQIIKQ